MSHSRIGRRLALLLVSLIAGLAQAQTLRWSSQGDMQTTDPHSQNEVMTNSLNNQVYEALTRRMKDLSMGPSLATEWTQATP